MDLADTKQTDPPSKADVVPLAPPDEKTEEQAKSGEITYIRYSSEEQLPLVQSLIEKDLSEPYSIFTYRYFMNNWPFLTFLAMCDGNCVGTIVCKLAPDRKNQARGYIAMLAVDKAYRKRGIGSTLVKKIIKAMKARNADLVVLETEVTNQGSLALYDKLGFVREKRLCKYYLNGVDAFRLKLWLKAPITVPSMYEKYEG